jgi:putative acetyltransferase
MPKLHSVKFTQIIMKTNNITIRETIASDFADIMAVIKEAFGYHKEAELTADLLADSTAEPMVSLLAFHGDKPVGHILFTRAYFADRGHQPMMHILAPLAVKPEYQGQGVGGMLIKEGTERLSAKGSHIVFVLGHKDYYPRHGFLPDAGAQGYPAPFPIPEEFKDCWMTMPLSSQGFEVGNGNIACCEAMNKPEHWRDDKEDR